MYWAIVYKYINGKYEMIQAGSNPVITEVVDKVLPVEEHVARQAEKLEFDGDKLCLKEGERLMSLEELNAEDEAYDFVMGGYMEPEKNTVKVEL